MNGYTLHSALSEIVSLVLRFWTEELFPRYLAKFQSVTNIGAHGFWAFIAEHLRPPLIFLVPSLTREFEKTTSFSQKYRTG